MPQARKSMGMKENAKALSLKKKITAPYQLLTIKHLKQTSYQNKTLQTPPIPMQPLTTLQVHFYSTILGCHNYQRVKT